MKTNRIFFSVLICLLYTNICFAQRGDKSNRISLMSKELSMSNEKANQLINALDDKNDKIQNAFRDTSLKVADKQQLISRLMVEQRSMIKSLLNENQQKKFKDLFNTSHEKAKKNYESILATHKQKYNKPLKGATLEKSEVKN